MNEFSDDEFERNLEYQITMSIARRILERGIITREQYKSFNTKMMVKYEPKTGDLFSDIDLT